MKFVETSTQFIDFDEDLKYDDSVKIYDLTVTTDMNERFTYSFPQFEIILVSKGELYYRSAVFINFRGLELRTQFNRSKVFFLQILNVAKKNKNYSDEISKFCKQHYSEEWFTRHRSVFETPNIKAEALEKVISKLEEENIQLKERLSQISNLANT